MSTEPSPRAEQIQANVAAALSRLRGEPVTNPGQPAAPAQQGGHQAMPGAPQPMQRPAPTPDQILTEAEPLFSVEGDPAQASQGMPSGDAAEQAPGDPELRASPFERMTGLKADHQPDLLQGIDVSPPPLADLPDAESEALRGKRRTRNRLMLGGAVIVLLAGFWILSGGDSGSPDIPVIKADGSPERVKPEDEGGMAVPNQDVAILNDQDSAATAQPETVLPAPEQPAAPPVPPEPTEPTEPALADVSAAQVPATVATAPEAASAASPAIPSVSAPDVDAIPSVPAPTELGIADQPTGMASDPAAAAPAEAAAATAAETTGTQSAAAEAAPTDLPKVSAAIQPVPGGTARIQLASVKSEAGARQEWVRLQKAYPAILGGLELHVERFEKSANEIYYRVQAGPLGDKASAKQICADLKQKNQACIVAK